MANPYNNPLDTSQDGGYSFLSRNRSSGLLPDIPQPTSHPRLSNITPLLNPPQAGNYSELYTTHHSYIRTGSGAADSDRNTMASEGTGSGIHQQSSHFPSFSRAFEMFISPAGDSTWPSLHRNNGLLVPSYLANSAYIQKLKEAHASKQAQREAQPQTVGSSRSPSSQASVPSVTSKPIAHLGITYDLIERTPMFEDNSSTSPLPTRWNRDDKQGGLEVMADGLEVKYTSPKPSAEREYEAHSIRADHPAPSEAGIYYFEITILSRKRDETTVCVGFAARSVALGRQPGWEKESYGYHGDDGQAYLGDSSGKHYGPPYTTHDTVGCGINFRTRTIFFTRNGVNLDTAAKDIKSDPRDRLYPIVGLKRNGEHVQTNFGQTPFIFDIDGMMKQEQLKVKQEIAGTSIAKLAGPKSNETELLQQLVLQFLQHDGYVETARAFAEEIQSEKRDLSLDANAPVEGINIKDDEDANRRQRIRKSILDGDVDKAFKYTQTYYPDVLNENQHVYFKLRCRKFIEMVRRSSSLNSHHKSISKKSNGHFVDDNLEMDLDEDGFSDQMDTQDRLDASAEDEASALLGQTISYGQELQAEFKDNASEEMKKTLNDVFALMAYPNPVEQTGLKHFFERKARAQVAEELNSAILRSLGRSSRSALETVYAQTSVLLDYLREIGGPGSFVTVQGVIDDIPKPSSSA